MNEKFVKLVRDGQIELRRREAKDFFQNICHELGNVTRMWLKSCTYYKVVSVGEDDTGHLKKGQKVLAFHTDEYGPRSGQIIFQGSDGMSYFDVIELDDSTIFEECENQSVKL